jgi:hypothetical protein
VKKIEAFEIKGHGCFPIKGMKKLATLRAGNPKLAYFQFV